MSKPLLLDLFCCQGGASKGYVDAGFEVLGVDIDPQPRYPYTFIQDDALAFLRQMLDEDKTAVAAVHASPPCQAYTACQRIRGNDHPDLVGPVRVLLKDLGLPYVIENVPGAPLDNEVMLCGDMFGLRMYRHRLFETNWPLKVPVHRKHTRPQVKMGRAPKPTDMLQLVGNFSGVEEARQAIKMPWANREGLREAIPPAYAEYIGHQLMEHLNV